MTLDTRGTSLKSLRLLTSTFFNIWGYFFTRAASSDKGLPVSFITRRETLRIDLAKRRFLSWEAVMEQHTGQGAATPETWEKAVERAFFTWSTR